MNYKRPTSPVFWVPVPDTGQSRADLIGWKLTETKQPPVMTLTDPDSGDYSVEIWDYLGPYEMEQIPCFLARQIVNAQVTGRALAAVLRQRLPEFKNCRRIYFYQVNPIQ